MWLGTVRAEVRFWFSKGDQFHKGVVVVRVREGLAAERLAGGDAVALLKQLLSLHRSFPATASLASNGTCSGGGVVFTQSRPARAYGRW